MFITAIIGAESASVLFGGDQKSAYSRCIDFGNRATRAKIKPTRRNKWVSVTLGKRTIQDSTQPKQRLTRCGIAVSAGLRSRSFFQGQRLYPITQPPHMLGSPLTDQHRSTQTEETLAPVILRASLPLWWNSGHGKTTNQRRGCREEEQLRRPLAQGCPPEQHYATW